VPVCTSTVGAIFELLSRGRVNTNISLSFRSNGERPLLCFRNSSENYRGIYYSIYVSYVYSINMCVCVFRIYWGALCAPDNENEKNIVPATSSP
jgi:hypothetical protein